MLMEAKLRLEEISGEPCIITHYLNMSPAVLSKIPVQAILISGNFADWPEYNLQDFKGLMRIINEESIPTLGLCGGHQLLALTYGGKVDPMRPLKPGEDDPWPEFYPGFYKESGFTEVQIGKEDPLFEGLTGRVVVNESHFAEIKVLPREFEVIASNQNCVVQAIRHRTKPIYGTQFHPEDYDAEHHDGKLLLRNFFKIAGVIP
jgi:GMP synthase (glutamine-hydrolysing)